MKEESEELSELITLFITFSSDKEVTLELSQVPYQDSDQRPINNKKRNEHQIFTFHFLTFMF